MADLVDIVFEPSNKDKKAAYKWRNRIVFCLIIISIITISSSVALVAHGFTRTFLIAIFVGGLCLGLLGAKAVQVIEQLREVGLWPVKSEWRTLEDEPES